MALHLSHLSREEKDEYVDQRMEVMKFRNMALKQRFEEVEQDRIKAEAKDSAVTSLKVSKKGNFVIGKSKVEDIPTITKEREWDKGKRRWRTPKFQGYSSEEITDTEQFTNTKETNALRNVLFSVHESYKNCLEVYAPMAQKIERFYRRYRAVNDTKTNKRFLLFLSRKFIKITNHMISIQMSFEKIDRELQFIYVIIDNCLTSAIEFFFESTKRIFHILLSVNDLMSKCVKELEAKPNRVEKIKTNN